MATQQVFLVLIGHYPATAGLRHPRRLRTSGGYILSFYTMLEESAAHDRLHCARIPRPMRTRERHPAAVRATYVVQRLHRSPAHARRGRDDHRLARKGGERITIRCYHMVRNFRTQYDVFEKCAPCRLSDPPDRVHADPSW